MRTIGIVGRDFCGSTLLSRMMAAIPDVASVGEIHWLLHAPLRRGRCLVCDPTDVPPPKIHTPATSIRCKIFTKDFITSGLRERTLYRRTLEQFGRGVLVTSDKSVAHLNRFGNVEDTECIVLVRSVYGTTASDIRRGVRSVQKSVDHWEEVYKRTLAWSKKSRHRVVLTYERLVEDPIGIMNRLSSELNLQKMAKSDLLSGSEYHHVGGNHLAIATTEVRSDNRWKTELSDGNKKIIGSRSEVHALYEKLRKMSI